MRTKDDYEEIAASWEAIEGHGDEATASNGPRQSTRYLEGWDKIRSYLQVEVSHPNLCNQA